MRLHQQEEVPLDRLGLSRGTPGATSRDEGPSSRTARGAYAFGEWRPRLASFATLVTLALLGAVPAAGLAAARMIAAARRPTVGLVAAQLGMALFLTLLTFQWVRPSRRARPLHVLGIAASTTSLVLPAVVFWMRPALAEPAAEMPGVLATCLIGLAFAAAALPPLFLALRATENTDCQVAPRVAFTSGVWLALVAAVTQIGAPRWFALCAAAVAIVAALLLFFAARRSSRDASALEGAASERAPRLRIVREPEQAAAIPPDLVPIRGGDSIAWLVHTDAASEAPYRAASTGVPLAAIPVPVDRAVRSLKSRSTGGFVVGSLSLALAASQIGQPAPRRITDLLLTEDRVMVELSDGTVESAYSSQDPHSEKRSAWQLLSSSGVLATTDPRLLGDKPTEIFRDDRGALFTPGAEKVHVQVVVGRMHACALGVNGSVVCWGENNAGQLGRPADSAWGSALKVAGLPPAVEVRAQGDVSCARTHEDRVFCWGRTEGRFTDAGPAETPREVSELPDVVRFEADEHGVCGIRHDGHLACWPHRTTPRDGDSR